jgi:adenylate kinase family enzyme
MGALPGRRIVVVGTSGSGKTTLARELAAIIDAPHIELDALHWGPNWQPAPLEAFRGAVEAALAGERWVVEGNYAKVRDIVWRRADTVIWLNYSLATVFRRLLRRTVTRAVRKEPLWHGNRESLRQAFFSRESILLWALQTHYPNRGKYSALFACQEFAHLKRITFNNAKDAAAWLTALRYS